MLSKNIWHYNLLRFSCLYLYNHDSRTDGNISPPSPFFFSMALFTRWLRKNQVMRLSLSMLLPLLLLFCSLGPFFRHLNSSQSDENDSCKSSHPGSSREETRKKPYVKKPLNAFMLFMKEMRPKVISECTLKESAAINQILGQRVSSRDLATFACDDQA